MKSIPLFPRYIERGLADVAEYKFIKTVCNCPGSQRMKDTLRASHGLSKQSLLLCPQSRALCLFSLYQPIVSVMASDKSVKQMPAT